MLLAGRAVARRHRKAFILCLQNRPITLLLRLPDCINASGKAPVGGSDKLEELLYREASEFDMARAQKVRCGDTIENSSIYHTLASTNT